ncbi:YegP family protein [Paraconexibacter algicola]|uniref:DUF1508 domain-containing protein n=1 Tax=Paraconexibacter algicola TaxID=2133960 RepID=A0A2T4UI68_9ACTN|nr:DUF1508 domain-containing protein [Paraconexibacter algicola]PTL58895.1 DUF1508 domain-containing protein [Paraconexibacter algicola]
MYFRIRYDADGYRALAYASNHQLIWWTEGYVSKADARRAIDLIKREGPGGDVHQ